MQKPTLPPPLTIQTLGQRVLEYYTPSMVRALVDAAYAAGEGLLVRSPIDESDNAADDIFTAEMYTAAEFKAQLALNVLGPEDGTGFWAKGEFESNISCWTDQPEGMTHVMWYNK